MSSHLKICLFGTFRVTRDGKLISSVGTAKMRSLIAYLIVHRDAPQLRSHLAFQFWADSTEKQALTNLRHLLHELRHELPSFEGTIAADSRTLRWRTDSPFEVDVVTFERALADAVEAAHHEDSTAKAALELAETLYTGELLPGCYDEWVEAERERLHQSAITTLERLVKLHEERRDYARALHYAQRLPRLDPARESGTCAIMRLHLLLGDRAAALHSYRSCVATLQRELAVGPGKKLRDLHDRALLDATAPEPETITETAARRQEHPLHGRHAEWRALLTAWKEAAIGRAGVVTLHGVAGIGKSRLAEELCIWVERQGGTVARTRSYAAEGRLAYAPATQWLRSPALRPQLLKLDTVWLAQLVRILPELRTERLELREPPRHEAGWQRQHLFEALSRAVVGVRKPLLLLLDDLQWTDQETLEWLRFLMRFAPAAPLLLLTTARTEELSSHQALQALSAELRRSDQLTEIELGPLDISDAASVAEDVAGREWTPAEMARLYSETEGNPLFVVESVRAGWRISSSAESPPSAAPRKNISGSHLSLPPKVHAVLVTRLAQLSPTAREVAGVAAIIGRAFSFEVLSSVYSRPEDKLLSVLDELWQRRVIGEQGQGVYDFTHDKLREVAYAEIIAPRRRLLHRRTADALRKLYSNTLDTVRGQVAAHLEAAGDITEAIAAYHDAAEAAKRLNASDEAIRLFQKALRLLESLPETPARAQQELTISTALGVCFVAAQGYPASEVWGLYERARELCRRLDRRTDAPILRALAIASLTRGNLVRALSLGEEILAGFESSHDPVEYVEGHYVLGVTFFWLGRFVDSRRHLEIALEHYDPGRRQTHLSLYAQDPRAVCLCRLGWTLWYLGFPDQAAAKMDEARGLSLSMGHPHTQGYVLYFGAQLAADARDERRALELLCELERLTERHSLQFWSKRGQVLAKLIRASLAGSKEALANARANIVACSSLGDVVNFSQFLGHAAELYLHHGMPEGARACLTEALGLLEKVDERYYHAELQRLEGELLLHERDDVVNEAETWFQKALHLAREQSSKSLELRAAMSLGRLWHGRGETVRAHELLQTVHDWFSEGLQSPDLVQARAHLECWR